MHRLQTALAFAAFLLVSLTLRPAVAEDFGVYWSRTSTFTTSASCLSTTPYVATCTLFAAGDVDNTREVRITANGAAHCCWVDSVHASSTRLYMTDSSGPNGSGQGACMHFFAAGQNFMGRPNRAAMIASHASGYRSGVCSKGVSSGGETLYAPCTANGDCSSPYGGGTCIGIANVTAAQKAGAGAFLQCTADSGTPMVSAQKLKTTL